MSRSATRARRRRRRFEDGLREAFKGRHDRIGECTRVHGLWRLSQKGYRKEHWEGSFGEHLDIVRPQDTVYWLQDRIGIGTFQPKDEKNQDSTVLTGDINYRKIAESGTDSDPLAFKFDGELNIANRSLVEFIEVLNPA